MNGINAGVITEKEENKLEKETKRIEPIPGFIIDSTVSVGHLGPIILGLTYPRPKKELDSLYEYGIKILKNIQKWYNVKVFGIQTTFHELPYYFEYSKRVRSEFPESYLGIDLQLVDVDRGLDPTFIALEKALEIFPFDFVHFGLLSCDVKQFERLLYRLLDYGIIRLQIGYWNLLSSERREVISKVIRDGAKVLVTGGVNYVGTLDENKKENIIKWIKDLGGSLFLGSRTTEYTAQFAPFILSEIIEKYNLENSIVFESGLIVYSGRWGVTPLERLEREYSLRMYNVFENLRNLKDKGYSMKTLIELIFRKNPKEFF